jgi:hypothetical protein
VRSLILAELRHRRGRAAALLAGLFVATLSFTVLTGTSETQRLEVRGTVARSFRSAYDILVRPRGSRTPLERRAGLVRPNYLSGLFGGITLRQWRRIRSLPGVAVAAPIANVGYVLPTFTVPVDLTRLDPGHGRVVLRVRIRWISERGLTRIDDVPGYVYVTDRPILPLTGRGIPSIRSAYRANSPHEVMPGGRRVRVCTEEGVAVPADGPFDPRYRMALDCFSRRTGLAGERRGWGPFPPGHVGLRLQWPAPFLLAAIDPREEARLTGLARAVVDGRYLHARDGVRDVPAGRAFVRHLAVPVLTASRSLVDEAVELRIERFTGRAADAVPRQPLPDTITHPLKRYLSRLTGGEPVERRRITPAGAFQTLLDSLRQPPRAAAGPEVAAYWTVGPTTYGRRGRTLVPRATPRAPASTWDALAQIGPRHGLVPAATRDLQFRRLVAHAGHWRVGDGEGAPWPLPRLFSIGEFDPRRLRSFDPRSAVPLETYAAPYLTPGNDRARRLLHGRSLAPNGNLGGYLAQPPLLLTTLRAARAFGRQTFAGASDAQPISSIRVRVAGVSGPDAVSRERIRLAAQRIAQTTHLDVDITTGSSVAPTPVELPAGRFGRPALLVDEPWVKKNVATTILAAIDRKSVVLFGLILVVCALFVANATAAAVRGRRTELGVLAALGWSGTRLFGVVLGELALLGAAAGLLAAGVSLPLAGLAHVGASPLRAALAIPAACLLAMVSGWLPAFRAARLAPVAAIRPPVVSTRRSWRSGGLIGLALISMLRVPGRALLGASCLAIGVCALTLLLAATFTFSDTLVGTILGDAISVQVRGSDYAAVAITLVLAAGAVTDVLFLNVREREGELATLRATGWDDGSLSRLIALEGLWLGLVGSAVGCAAGLAGTVEFTGRLTAALLVTGAAAALLGLGVAAGASVVPGVLLRRRSLAVALAAE